MDTKLGDITLGQFLAADLKVVAVMGALICLWAAGAYVVSRRGRK